MCPFCSRAQAEPRLQPRTHVCLLFFSHSAMPDSSQPHVIAACQPSLSSTSFLSLLKLMSAESGVPSNHLILCRPLLLLLSIFPSIKGCLLSSFLFLFSFLSSSSKHSLNVSEPVLGKLTVLRAAVINCHKLRGL